MSKVFPHLKLREVREKIKQAKSFWIRQKWLIVYNAMVDPRTAKQIANHTGVSVGTVNKTISQYNRYGSEAIETVQKGGRRNCYLSLEEEKEFLSNFLKKAEKGQIPTVKEIKLAYEKKVGKTINKTTIYRLLDRHKWRKIVPRPCHPKSVKSEKEAFKKTSQSK